jgi:hypothetical protein
MLILIILLVLLCSGGFGFHQWGYAGGGISLGVVLLLVLLVFLMRGGSF